MDCTRSQQHFIATIQKCHHDMKKLECDVSFVVIVTLFLPLSPCCDCYLSLSLSGLLVFAIDTDENKQ